MTSNIQHLVRVKHTQKKTINENVSACVCEREKNREMTVLALLFIILKSAHNNSLGVLLFYEMIINRYGNERL